MQQALPASVQLFLFADKVVPANNAFSAGTRISFSQKKVKTNELATYLLAFTIWDLFERECVNMEVRKVKKMFFISAEKLFAGIKKDIPVSGDLENWLIRGLQNEADIKKIIHDLFKKNVVWPHKQIVHIVSADACDFGVGKISESYSGKNSVLRALSGEIDFDVERSLVSELETGFDIRVQQWNQFLVSSAAIAGHLITGCRAALNSRVIQND